VPERVRSDGFADSGTAGGLADDLPGAVPVQPPPIGGQEHRPICTFADGQVDRPRGARRERDGDDLAALAGDGQRPVPAFQAQLVDVGAGGLGDPQPVQREQGDQRMVERRTEPGGYQQGAQFVAVQRDGMRFIVDPRPPDVRGRGVIQEFFFDRVLVEPGDGAQPPGDGGAGTPVSLQVAGEAFDVGAANGEQVQGADVAPGGELAQVQAAPLSLERPARRPPSRSRDSPDQHNHPARRPDARSWPLFPGRAGWLQPDARSAPTGAIMLG
jgi:hypothetical protein